MRGAARFATYLGRILMAVGFLMIVIGWNGAASLDFIQGQFPFLLSGAVPGLALIIIGAGLEYIQAVRQFSAKRARQMAELNVAVVKLVGHIREDGGLRPTAAAPPVAPDEAPTQQIPTIAPVPVGVATAPPAPQPAGATAASAQPPAAEGAATSESGAETVVAGRSSFHRPDCHLVSGRDDMMTLEQLEAVAQGLSACRVCKP